MENYYIRKYSVTYSVIVKFFYRNNKFSFLSIKLNLININTKCALIFAITFWFNKVQNLLHTLEYLISDQVQFFSQKSSGLFTLIS